MINLSLARSARMFLLSLGMVILISACGGGGSADAPVAATPPVAAASTGTVILLLTDAPIDDLSAINLDVTEATLIGDMGQQQIFSGNKTINLLDLANFEQPIVFGEVEAGDYTKIRLRIENVELVDKNTGDSFFTKLPANGKIDLLDQGGFTVFPGRTVFAEIDFDANKSIHIVGTGSDKYLIRPVVKVNIMDGGLPSKLTRLEGTVKEIFDDPAGSFLLCHADDAESCIIVNMTEETCVFDAEGKPTGIDALAEGDTVVVIGRFRHEDDDDSDDDGVDMDVELDAIVIEIGGNASQVKGIVLGKPDDNGKFELAVGPDVDMTVQLQEGTKIFSEDGLLDPEAIAIGDKILVEGVVETSDNADVNDLIWAALIFVDGGGEDESLSGKIAEPLDDVNKSFNVMTDVGDICVNLVEEARIFLVSQDDTGTVVKEGMFGDLEAGQSVEVFGESGIGGCFQASEVVVDLTPAP